MATTCPSALKLAYCGVKSSGDDTQIGAPVAASATNAMLNSGENTSTLDPSALSWKLVSSHEPGGWRTRTRGRPPCAVPDLDPTGDADRHAPAVARVRGIRRRRVDHGRARPASVVRTPEPDEAVVGDRDQVAPVGTEGDVTGAGAVPVERLADHLLGLDVVQRDAAAGGPDGEDRGRRRAERDPPHRVRPRGGVAPEQPFAEIPDVHPPLRIGAGEPVPVGRQGDLGRGGPGNLEPDPAHLAGLARCPRRRRRSAPRRPTCRRARNGQPERRRRQAGRRAGRGSSVPQLQHTGAGRQDELVVARTEEGARPLRPGTGAVVPASTSSSWTSLPRSRVRT